MMKPILYISKSIWMVGVYIKKKQAVVMVI